MAGEHLVCHDAEGVDVGAVVDLLALALFGRHELGCSDDEAGAGGVLVPSERLGDTEVEHQTSEVWRDQNVRGFDVAVDDARLVRCVESLGDLTDDFDRSVQRPRLPRKLRAERSAVAMYFITR